MKKISLIVCMVLIVATLTAVFVGCNGNSNDPNQITVWWPSGKAMQDIIENAVKDFTATHPEAKINIVNKPVDAFEAYKYALNDNKTRPDVAIVDHVYIAALANDKQLADLTALGCDDVKSQYPQHVFEACTYDGQAYGLPFSANTVVLMYNKDILSACGVSVPKTMDELLAACKTVSEKGYIAFAQPQNDFAVMEFVSYAARCGGKVVSDDYKTVTFDNSGVSKAIDKWIALSKYASQSTYEEDKFYNGKVAFVEMGSWALTSVTGSSKRFDCGFAEMVTIDEDTPNYSGLGLYSLCIAEKSANKQLALEFAKYLSTNKTVQLAYNKDKNLFPVTNEALSDEYYTQNDALKVYAAQLQKVAARPSTPVWPDMESALQNMLFEIVRSDGNYSTIVTKYQNKVQQATDRVFK